MPGTADSRHQAAVAATQQEETSAVQIRLLTVTLRTLHAASGCARVAGSGGRSIRDETPEAVCTAIAA